MKNNIYFFEDIIEEIENNLTTEINISSLAKKANMSVYEFRRIFTFVAKIPINEYIRKRRLSLAAIELSQEKSNVTQVAIKCGYDTASSFSRAFKEYHGISPTEVREKNISIKLLSRVGADIITTGGNDISYQIEQDDAFVVYGVEGESNLSDTECCEKVWQEFYETDYANTLPQDEKLYACYTNRENSVNVILGIRDVNNNAPNSLQIPASLWVCFKMNTVDDTEVNKIYKEILLQWLESAGYERNYALPNIEIYPVSMEEEGFLWEIRIPVKRRNDNG
jgi:AraC family transcriptional regulator